MIQELRDASRLRGDIQAFICGATQPQHPLVFSYGRMSPEEKQALAGWFSGAEKDLAAEMESKAADYASAYADMLNAMQAALRSIDKYLEHHRSELTEFNVVRATTGIQSEGW